MLKVEQVRTLATEARHAYDLGTESEGIRLNFKQMEDIIECLEWTEQQLNQRRVNSRKYLKRQSTINRLIKNHLSKDELEEIDAQARRAAEGDDSGVENE